MDCRDGVFDVHTFNGVTEILPAVVSDSRWIQVRHRLPRFEENGR
jgi:hypothetical protein